MALPSDSTRDLGEPEYRAFRAVFEAIPSPAFIVDDDVSLLSWNRAGQELLEEDPARSFNRRGGEAMHCLNAQLSAGGCGHARACQDCVIRQSVSEACRGGTISRHKTRVNLLRGGKTVELYLRVSASPLEVGGERRALLILEDISDIVRLQSLLPICAWCGRVRTPENTWQTLAEYVSSRADVDFTHSICGDCYDRVMPGRHRAD